MLCTPLQDALWWLIALGQKLKTSSVNNVYVRNRLAYFAAPLLELFSVIVLTIIRT